MLNSVALFGLTSFKQGNSVSTNTIDQLCTLLHCTVGEVMEFIEPEGDN